MTTTATPRPDTFFTGLDQARSVKRLGLGPKFYDSGVSIPELVEQPDGPYITHADYLKLLHLAELREAVNKVLEAEVEQLLAEQEAIGAGGISQGAPLNVRERLMPYLQACEHAWWQVQKEGTPENNRAFDDARVKFWEAL
ncbi:MAG: hypothetical protein GX086_07215 [Alcaligenaceae bacterium]|nr:hypothetical protein [Alcaligenaceae bacterium]